ncbi:MAG: type II toxin-antitoxin system RelE/ParE family toxin [Pseudomonadota bacterium]
MPRLVVLPAARADLIEIGDFIATDNPPRALRFMTEIETRMLKILDMPGASVPRNDLHPGLRSVRHGRYAIYFVEVEDKVRIVRVLHTSRDVEGVDWT